MLKKCIVFSFVILFVLFFNACAPSYPFEVLDKKTEEIIEKETGYKANVFLKDTTLYIYLHIKDGIDASLTADSDVFKVIQQVLLLSTRVSLSTDADIEFFSVIIANEKIGLQIIFKQYIEDVKRWFYGNISRNDFFNRSVLETKFSKDGYVFNEDDFSSIKMSNFILDQTIYRLRAELNDDIEKFKKQRIKYFNDEEKIEEIDGNIREYATWLICLESVLKSKEFLNILDSGNFFSYDFDAFDENDFLRVDLEGLYEKLADVNERVCNIYKFVDYAGVFVKIDNEIVYEKFV